MGLNGPPKKMMEIQPCFMEVISMKFRSWGDHTSHTCWKTWARPNVNYFGGECQASSNLSPPLSPTSHLVV